MAVPTMSAANGFVETTAGKRIEGKVAIERGKVVVTPAAGEVVTVPFDQLRWANFGREKSKEPVAQSDAASEPLKAKTMEGLRGEYFAEHDMKDRRLVRVDRELNLWWGSAPDPAVPKGFSVRWTGFIQPRYSEKYTFEADLIGGMRMWIDEKMIIDQWQARPGNVSGTAVLTAGKAHAVKIEFHDAMWAGLMRLFWSSQSQGREVIPSRKFKPPTGTVIPAAALRRPPQGPIFRMPEMISLEADSDDSSNKIDFLIDEQVIGTSAKRPWQVEWAKPTPGYHKAIAQATNGSGISSQSEPRFIAVGGNAGGALPDPWMEMPVGKQTSMGSAIKFEGRKLTIEDAFGNLWSQGDGYRYVFQALEGDGSISARFESFDASNEEAAAGLLVRENSPTTRAQGAFLGVAREGLQFRRCDNYWQEPVQWDEQAKLPCWLKLSRYGRDVRAYTSEDGREWKRIAAIRVEMPQQVMLGFVIGSPGREPSRAVFDKISMSGGPPSMAHKAKGVILRGGSSIAGSIRAMDDSVLRLATASGEISIPRGEIARIVFQPLTAELAEGLAGARQGMLVATGDFIDGQVQTVATSGVVVSSVLFGARKYTKDEVIVAVLREISPQPSGLQIELADGSSIQASTASPTGDRLDVSIGSGVNLSVVGTQITEIRRP